MEKMQITMQAMSQTQEMIIKMFVESQQNTTSTQNNNTIEVGMSETPDNSP
jgi:hypothetical protein